jgi:hypothetical protein
MTSPARFTLYLSKEGDSVEIKNLNDTSTIPEQLEAASCKTHSQVLSFLEKINTSEAKNNLEFWHKENPAYLVHYQGKGVAHPCAIDQQIEFVRFKIAEEAQGPRQQRTAAQNTWCVLLKAMLKNPLSGISGQLRNWEKILMSKYMAIVAMALLISITAVADETLNDYYEIAKENCHDLVAIRKEMDRINKNLE